MSIERIIKAVELDFSRAPQFSTLAEAVTCRDRLNAAFPTMNFTFAFANETYYVVAAAVLDEFLAWLGPVTKLPTQTMKGRE